MGVTVGQLAVAAAARRAGRIPPADALREVAIEHPRPGFVRTLSGAAFLLGGVAMALVFSGFWAMVFAILGGMLLAMGVGLLGRWLLGFPAALLGAPLRRLGAAGLLAGTGLAANRWRTAALATPIVLVTMLVGIQGVVESSNQSHTEEVTRDRVHASWIVVGSGGAPLPAATAARSSGARRGHGGHSRGIDRGPPRGRGARRPSPVAGRGAQRRPDRARPRPDVVHRYTRPGPRRRGRGEPGARRRRRPADRRDVPRPAGGHGAGHAPGRGHLRSRRGPRGRAPRPDRRTAPRGGPG